VFLPNTYKPDGGPYPTLVFMHGSGEAGSDGNGLFAGDLGPAADLRHQPGSTFINEFPMILISPQCPPRGERWDQEPTLRAALGVLDDAQRKLRIDPDRLYITGLSMGGKGTWLLAGLDPDRFAAICPISSSTLDLSIARRMRYASVWAINGSEDIEDGADHQHRMIAAAHDAGGDAELTILDGRGHDVWNDYYSDPNFYQWFLKHRRLTAAERAARDATAARLAATRPTSGPATRPGAE
jgi:predicted peptidase